MNQVLNILKESDKDALIERYADLNFIDDVSTVKCIKCGKVAISHFLSGCDHLFCKSCKNDQLKNKWNCPLCRATINTLMRQSIGVQLKIYGLRVSCPNKKIGCRELASLVEISNHLKECQLTKTIDATVNTNVDSRIKDVIVRVDELSSSVAKTQEQLQKMENLLDKTFRQFQMEQDRINQQFQKMEKFLQFWTETNFTWPINSKDGAGFSLIDNENMVAVRRLFSPSFLISGQSIKTQAILMGSGYIYLIFRHFQASKKQQLILSNPLPRITYTVSQVVEERNSSQEAMKLKNDVNIVEQHIGFINQFKPGSSEYQTPMVQLFSDVKPFLTGNPFIINIKVDYPHLIYRPSSTNGTLEWKIGNFMQEIGHLFSPYFYTSPQGYRVNIELAISYLELVASVKFLTGEHDQRLPRTSYFNTTITMVDQTSSSTYGDVVKCTKSSTSQQAGDGIQMWSSKSNTPIKNYLKDNALLLKIQLTLVNELVANLVK
ncbi:hypothetical protein CHUAL_003672 [Chamberlinius hualienensis]